MAATSQTAAAIVLALAVGTATAAGPPPLRPAGTVPYAPATLVIDLFGAETAFSQQSSSGRSALDFDDPVRGDGSLRVTTRGDGVQVNLRAGPVGPLDLADAHLRLVVRVDGVEHLEHVLLYLSSDGFAHHEAYRLLRGDGDDAPYAPPGDWATVTLALGTPLARSGPVDHSRVTDLQLLVVDTGRGPVAAWFDVIEAVARPARGVVSLVFDDARDGAYRLARPILDAHGLRASVAVIVDLIGTPGFMTLPELQRLERHAGWDVIAHHASALPDGVGFDRLDDAEVRAELERTKAWLLDHGFHRGADHLAYPYGGLDARSAELARRYYASGRTIARGIGLETLPPGDPYRIRALSVTDRDTPEELMAAIDRAAGAVAGAPAAPARVN